MCLFYGVKFVDGWRVMSREHLAKYAKNRATIPLFDATTRKQAKETLKQHTEVSYITLLRYEA